MRMCVRSSSLSSSCRVSRRAWTSRASTGSEGMLAPCSTADRYDVDTSASRATSASVLPSANAPLAQPAAEPDGQLAACGRLAQMIGGSTSHTLSSGSSDVTVSECS